MIDLGDGIGFGNPIYLLFFQIMNVLRQFYVFLISLQQRENKIIFLLASEIFYFKIGNLRHVALQFFPVGLL